MSLGPNHWRYRYADQLARPLPLIAINAALVAAGVIGFVLGEPWILLIWIILAAPFGIILAQVGCWRCNYNLLRRYRGPGSSEHGDSWTNEPLYPWNIVRVPADCPRCGASILSPKRVTSQEHS